MALLLLSDLQIAGEFGRGGFPHFIPSQESTILNWYKKMQALENNEDSSSSSNSGSNDDLSKKYEYWFHGSRAVTSMLDTYTLLVPDNERYYVRSLSRSLQEIKDPALRERILDFCRQETQHGVAHKKFWNRINTNERAVAKFINSTRFLLYGVTETLQPLWLRLSIVAAIEHVNAVLANAFLSEKLLDGCEQEPAALFLWHFAEEIEHKCVAHDVLGYLYPQYVLRLAGALVAFPIFGALIISGSIYLRLNECTARKRCKPEEDTPVLPENRRKALKKLTFGVLGYLRPSFSPNDIDDYYLASEVLNIQDTNDHTLSSCIS